jgi:hypothetical protein
VPACDVDNAQALHPEPKVSVDKNAAIVGAAMADCVALGLDQFPWNRPAISSVPSGNAAHPFVRSFGSLKKDALLCKSYRRNPAAVRP